VSEIARCPSCSHERIERLYQDCRNRREGVPGAFDVLRCLSCHLAFLSPRPSAEALAALYAQSYHSHTVSTPRQGLWAVAKALCLWPYRLRFGDERGTFPPFGPGRLLDVGCGTGDYLAAMTALGWQGTGCEISEAALAVARRRIPEVAWHHGEVETLPAAPGTFDAVTLWHTLEHLPDPRGTLMRIRTLLSPQGRLIVALPNLDSWEAKWLRRRWVELDIPSHLIFFSTTTLQAMLGQAGFTCTRIRPQVHPSTVSDACGFLLDDLRGCSRSRQRPWLYGLLYPPTVLSYALGNWGCLEVTARTR